MKFCMVTTFFGAHSFGGDAAYVDRLSRALLRRGHEVHVFHCADAFNAVRGDHPLRPYEPPPGLHVHRLESRFGILSPIATQVTGRPVFKAKALAEQIEAVDTDVVHFHNISLVGGPGVLGMGRNAVRLMTAHEHWLICPMHLLWKYDRKPCDSAQCVRCSLAGKRPPQLWRYSGAIERGLAELDALIFPSRHTLEEHRRRGISAPMVHLPYFLPDGWSGGIEDEPVATATAAVPGGGRAAGEDEGVSEADPGDEVPAGGRPEDRRDRALRAGAAGAGRRDCRTSISRGCSAARRWPGCSTGRRAVVVPSLFPETFGYVVLEAFAVRTPVVVHRGGGAIAETGVQSGGGLGYETDAEMLVALEAGRPRRRACGEELAAAGFAMRQGPWSEDAHLRAYFDLIQRCRRGKAGVDAPRPGGRPDRRDAASVRLSGGSTERSPTPMRCSLRRPSR